MKTLAQLLRRFGRAHGGAAAVEFALVAAPFIALLFAIVELGLVFLVQTNLDNATEDAARRIRTGELQIAKEDAAAFKADVCSQVTWLGSGCTGNLRIDVRVFGSFANQRNPGESGNGGINADQEETFIPGVGCSIVLVRTYYRWPLITPLLSSALINTEGNNRLISSAVAFRNEPFTQC